MNDSLQPGAYVLKMHSKPLRAFFLLERRDNLRNSGLTESCCRRGRGAEL